MKPLALRPQEQIAADQFRSFFAQLAAIRDEIRASPLHAPVDEGAEPAAGRWSLGTVRTALAKAITDLGYRPGDPVNAGAVDPAYVLAAVADEVIVVQCTEWADHEAWIDNPLEAVLFDSALAGDRIFSAAEDVLAGTSTDPRTATFILLALLTGFRGRYQGRDDRECIALFEAGLYARVCDRAYQLDDAAPYAGPNMIATTLTGESARPLPALWPWLTALVLVVLVYLPVSHFLWMYHAAPARKVAAEIIASKPDPTSTPLPPKSVR